MGSVSNHCYTRLMQHKRGDMYVDLGKLMRVAGFFVAGVIILLGVVVVFASKTADEQSSGTLMALFGLMLTWFIIWLGRD